MPTVSVIIPCYNQGEFVDEAVESVLAQSYRDFEIIIVNDGSTDTLTNALLATYCREKTRVIVTANMGLAAARNNGIAAASGKYILPLDADDRIGPTYLEQAVAVLDGEPQVGIVYCHAMLFGAVATPWQLPPYSLERMLLDNLIFCSAFFRREDWQAFGGYDPGMIYGWEDYDFWLGLIEKGRKVVRLEDTLFYYRVASDSMVRSKEKWQKVAMFRRIYERHQQLFSENIESWIHILVDAKDKYFTSRLYVDCGAGISDQSSVGRKIEHGTRRIVFDLSRFSGISALRFDPVDTWAVLKIFSIRIGLRSGEEQEVTAMESNALYSHEGRLFFDSCDSQCFFPHLEMSAAADFVSLTVDLEFVALGEAALQEIVGHQKGLLETLATETLPKKIRQVGRLLLQSFSAAEKGG